MPANKKIYRNVRRLCLSSSIFSIAFTYRCPKCVSKRSSWALSPVAISSSTLNSPKWPTATTTSGKWLSSEASESYQAAKENRFRLRLGDWQPMLLFSSPCRQAMHTLAASCLPCRLWCHLSIVKTSHRLSCTCLRWAPRDYLKFMDKLSSTYCCSWRLNSAHRSEPTLT